MFCGTCSLQSLWFIIKLWKLNTTTSRTDGRKIKMQMWQSAHLRSSSNRYVIVEIVIMFWKHMGSSVLVQNNTGCDAMCHVIMWKMKHREPQNVCGELNVINCDESNYVVGFMVFLWQRYFHAFTTHHLVLLLVFQSTAFIVVFRERHWFSDVALQCWSRIKWCLTYLATDEKV